MPVEVHHRSHLLVALQLQPFSDVQRSLLVFGIDDGDIQFVSQTDGLDDAPVCHPLHVLYDRLLLRGPEVLLMPEHLLVGISDIQTVGAQLFANRSQLVQVLLFSIHMVTPYSPIDHHKLTERNHPFQLCPH